MKTNNIILAVAVVTVAATVNLNARAAAPLLSPRTRDNPMRTGPGITENRHDRGVVPGSWLARDNEIKVVSGVHDDAHLAEKDRDVTASPRALKTFPRLARTAAKNRTGAADVATGQRNQ